MLRIHNKWWWGSKTTLILEGGLGLVQISIEKDDPNVAIIHDLGVVESFRRLGLGTKLLKAAEEEIRNNPEIHTISLSCMPSTFLVDWYQRLGYRISDESIDEESGYNLIDFTKEI